MIDIQNHRQLMYNLIQDIFALPYAKYIAFKGGTACYFLHKLDRFSTDIDLDILAGLPDDIDIDADIIALASVYGDVKKKSALVLSYDAGYAKIKIDINRRIRKSNVYEIVNFYGTDITIQDPGTIFANKCVALLERSANRDIYDVHFFLKNNFPLHQDIILERRGGTMSDFRSDMHTYIYDLGDGYNILDGLGEVLDQKQKTFVKHKLLKELLGLLQLRRDFA